MHLLKKVHLKKLIKTIPSKEKGVVAVIVAICLFAFMIATALAIDVGSLFEDRRHLQTVADSAALAGAQELPENRGEAINIATEYVSNNYSEDVDIKIEIEPVLVVAEASITVTVVNDESPLYLARVMGKDSTPVGAYARAIVAEPKEVGNIVPWGLDEEFFDDLAPGGEFPLKYHSPQEPGNFLALDLDPDGSHGGGANDYMDRIINGYVGPLSVGDFIYTETGNMAGPSVQAAIERIEVRGDGWQDFNALAEPWPGGYELHKADTQFVVVPMISLEGIEGQSEQVEILKFILMLVTRIEGSNPGQSNIIGTFINKALIISEGSALGPVGPEGLRVIRLIR